MVPAPVSLWERMIDSPIHVPWEARLRSRLQTGVSTDTAQVNEEVMTDMNDEEAATDMNEKLSFACDYAK